MQIAGTLLVSPVVSLAYTGQVEASRFLLVLENLQRGGGLPFLRPVRQPRQLLLAFLGVLQRNELRGMLRVRSVASTLLAGYAERHAVDHLARLLDTALAGSLLLHPNLPLCIIKTDQERRRTGGKPMDAFT